jgi:hypothetical protein
VAIWPVYRRACARRSRPRFGSTTPSAPTCSISPARPNAARFTFLDRRAQEFYADWNDTIAVLRASAVCDPYDRCLSDLVGELSTQSAEFRARWAQHNVREHITAIKHFHHPIVGGISLTYDRLDLVADIGLTILTYAAEPGSHEEETLKLLGSWAASRRADVTPATDRK